jgi:hypothetical protein
MKACVFALFVLSLPVGAQDRAYDDPLRLVVPMPEAIAALWRPDEAQAFAYAGGVRVGVADSVTTAAVFGTAQRDAVDKVLVLGGPHARWARRQEDGTWAWDSSGWVLAGRAPEPFRQSYVDVLGPLEGQLPAEGAECYPTFGTEESDEQGAFILGVPAPGLWQLILDAHTGPDRALASWQATQDSDLDPARLPLVSARPWMGEVSLDLAEGVPPSPREREVEVFVAAGASALRCSQLLRGQQGAWTLALPPQILGGRAWVWHPGWEVFVIEGTALRDVKDRPRITVRAGRTLVVRVTHATGKAASAIVVRLRNARNEVLPLPWGAVGDEAHARIQESGKTAADGTLSAFGLWTDVPLQLEVVPGGGAAPVTVPWDGRAQLLEVTLG